MSYNVSEHDRRLANIVRIGTVKELDEAAGTVTVEFDGELVTEPLAWMTGRAGPGARTWSAPEPGEQVVVVAPSGDISNGIVLPGAVYQDAYGAPSNTKNAQRVEFADGTVIQYDRSSHQMLIDVSASSGTVMIVCNEATVQAASKVTLDAPDVECTGNLKVGGNAEFEGGSVTHGGTDIGNTHTHSGVESGPSNTGGPN